MSAIMVGYRMKNDGAYKSQSLNKRLNDYGLRTPINVINGKNNLRPDWKYTIFGK